MLASLAKLEAPTVTVPGTVGIFLDGITFDDYCLDSRWSQSASIVTRDAISTRGLTAVLRLSTA